MREFFQEKFAVMMTQKIVSLLVLETNAVELSPTPLLGHKSAVLVSFISLSKCLLANGVQMLSLPAF